MDGRGEEQRAACAGAAPETGAVGLSDGLGGGQGAWVVVLEVGFLAPQAGCGGPDWVFV